MCIWTEVVITVFVKHFVAVQQKRKFFPCAVVVWIIKGNRKKPVCTDLPRDPFKIIQVQLNSSFHPVLYHYVLEYTDNSASFYVQQFLDVL